MKLSEYKEATRRLKEFSAWLHEITVDKTEQNRKLLALARFVSAITLSQQQLIADLKPKPKFPKGGVSMYPIGRQNAYFSDKEQIIQLPKRGRLDGIEGIVKPIAF